ncbi:hypothetical protein HOLleu_09218 [Holothuria leucospilota]|uniref:Uncharacterized protein n=1 Tax=Holothuria leucospilota TaxID=206669 RepID=A0A9Q1CKC6_HOLLE|nr:hypothetical protein HOLleu_09218 [Holothuria leucospilota]
MENLMCTEGTLRARSASSYAWGPGPLAGSRGGAPVGGPGGERSPRKLSQY